MKLKTLAASLVAALGLTLGGSGDGSLTLIGAAAAQAKVSPELGKHLTAVQGLLKGGKYKEALAKLRDAEGVANRSADENALIERMRFAGSQGAADPETMVRAYEALKGAGKLGGAENLQYMEAIAGTYSRNNANAQALTWAQRYLKEGGTSAAVKAIQTRSQFLSGDMGAVIKDTLAEIAAVEKAGQVPSKDKLNLLLAAAEKAKDANAESVGVDKLLAYYPSKEVWAAALGRVAHKKGFSDRLVLDLFRLRLATGNMRGEPDYLEFATMAAQAGFPDEGMKALEAGFAAGVLGQGKEAARHQRLKDFMSKRVAEVKAASAAAVDAAKAVKSDGNALLPLGLAQAHRGDVKGGIALIEEGIAKGNLKRDDDGKLALGLAHLLGGDVAKAQTAFKAVKGTDGAGDIARMWIVHSRSMKK